MIKKGGETSPNSQQYILQAFASWDYGGFFTMALSNSPDFPDSRLLEVGWRSH